MCDDNGDTFIATLHNVLLAPDQWDRLLSIIKLMNSGHTCLFHKGFCTVYFGDEEKNAVTLPHNAQRKHVFFYLFFSFVFIKNAYFSMKYVVK